MKICVFSDSHGHPELMTEAVAREKPAMCFFLGDGEHDLRRLETRFPDLPVQAVRGNCDLRSTLPLFLRCTVGGVRILAVHGHLLNVKYDPELHDLRQAGLDAEADVVLFGHTHEAYRGRSLGMELLNPGPIGPAARPGYGLLFIENGRAETALVTLHQDKETKRWKPENLT